MSTLDEKVAAFRAAKDAMDAQKAVCDAYNNDFILLEQLTNAYTTAKQELEAEAAK